MSSEAIYQKYADGLSAVGHEDGALHGQSVALALRLAVKDAYSAGLETCSGMADDLAAIVAMQTAAPRLQHDQRHAEQLQAQISRLNEWLAEQAPAHYWDDGDTADAVLAVLAAKQKEIQDLSEELAQTDADAAGLMRQVKELEAWKAKMLAEAPALAAPSLSTLTRASMDFGALGASDISPGAAGTLQIEGLPALSGGDAGALSSASSVSMNGGTGPAGDLVDPTQALLPAWGRTHPAWQGMTAGERETVYALATGSRSFRTLSQEQRLELVKRVIAHLAQGAGALPAAVYDARRPEWMAKASGLTKTHGLHWSQLTAMALG